MPKLKKTKTKQKKKAPNTQNENDAQAAPGFTKTSVSHLHEVTHFKLVSCVNGVAVRHILDKISSVLLPFPPKNS